MRVLHVSPYFAPAFVYGGPPRSIFGLCKALVACGVDVEVMTTTANGPDADLPAAVDAAVDLEGVRVRYFPLAWPRRVWRAPDLRRAIRRDIDSFDIVHVHGLWHLPGADAAAAARRSGVPYVVSPRGMLQPEALEISRTPKLVAWRAFQERELRGAAFLHATSDQEAGALARFQFGPPVATVPNGVEVLELSAAERGAALSRFGLSPSERYVLFLGRIHPIKRLDILAAAAGILRARDVTVVIAGPDERDHRRSIEPLFAASGLRTLWTGAVDDRDKAALLGGAQALVLCSDTESFGLSAAEALAAGTPVVATRTCPWEALEPEGAGRWVAQDPASIADALDNILASAALRREMGERARLLVERRYSWRANARALAAQYERAAAIRTRLHATEAARAVAGS